MFRFSNHCDFSSVSFNNLSVNKRPQLLVLSPSASAHGEKEYKPQSIQTTGIVCILVTTIWACDTIMKTVRVIDPSHMELAKEFATASMGSWSTKEEIDVTVAIGVSLIFASSKIAFDSWDALEFLICVDDAKAWSNEAADIIWNSLVSCW